MCLLDLVLERPALEDYYMEFYQTNGDAAEFFQWLSDAEIEIEVPPELQSVDHDFWDLVQNKLLAKLPENRLSVPDVLRHPFFMKHIEGEPADEAIDFLDSNFVTVNPDAMQPPQMMVGLKFYSNV